MLADLIKIHCLTHGVTFPMSRTSRTVVCKEGAEEHTLSTNFPNQGLWVYCCNCQTFIAWDLTQKTVTIRECPFCLSSLNPRAYCCDRCAVTMVDYDDQTLRKHHAVLSWGAPQPACAGCHQFPGATPKMHFCQALHTSLATARAVCTFCRAPVEHAGHAGANGAKSATNLEQALVAVREEQALAEARTRAREAEERIRLAEATARKEIELRVQAERKAEEIERKVSRELSLPPAAQINPDWSRREAEIARARAEAEMQARLEAEARAAEAETLRLHAEAAAEREAAMRSAAEQQARELAENLSAQPPPLPRKDRLMIALYAALAGVLVMLLIILVVTIAQM